MGNGVSRVVGCFIPVGGHGHDPVFFSEPLDEDLGHSFCYVHSTELQRGPFSIVPVEEPWRDRSAPMPTEVEAEAEKEEEEEEMKRKEGFFKAISGACISANTSTLRTISVNDINGLLDRVATFEGTASFAALPLQPVPHSGPISSSSSAWDKPFVSGPLERGFMSGPLERSSMSGPIDPATDVDRTHFSAPLSGLSYIASLRRRQRPRRSLRYLVRTVGKPVKKAIARTLSRTSVTFSRAKRSLAVPLKTLDERGKEEDQEERAKPCDSLNASSDEGASKSQRNIQWAQIMAGEDRVHVALSEEHGWLFVGIYDGFNGPDATDFLMSNLYESISGELQGLLWDRIADVDQPLKPDGSRKESLMSTSKRRLDNNPCAYPDYCCKRNSLRQCMKEDSLLRSGLEVETCNLPSEKKIRAGDVSPSQKERCDSAGEHLEAKRETPQEKTLPCQPMAESDNRTHSIPLDHNASHKKGEFSFRPGFTQVFSAREENQRPKHLHLPCQCGLEQPKKAAEKMLEENAAGHRGLKHDMANPQAILKALACALEVTEAAYLEMADRALEENPELALMGSCVLVMLMKGDDIYIVNVGDSRAILAQEANSSEKIGTRDALRKMELERIVEETPTELESFEEMADLGIPWCGPPSRSHILNTLQLSTDHSTSVKEEVLRIQAEHLDDTSSIFNDRVKGRLKVTRAFGSGFLKKPKWNCALLETFRVDYIGTSPYISCTPSLCHHRVGPRDRFIVLSSDGLYQYLSNEEVVSHVEWFMEKFPDGDPAQHLIEQLLFRAAKKAGIDFHELLEIPRGDRRKYHDDVSLMVISLNGKIWRSSG